MKKRGQISKLILMILGLVAIGSSGCNRKGATTPTPAPAPSSSASPSPSPSVSPSPTASPIVKGIGLSPFGFPSDYSKLGDFFTEVGAMPHGGAMWNGAWRDNAVSGVDSGTIPAAPAIVMSNAATYGYTPIAVFGWRSGTTLFLKLPANATNTWANTEAKAAFQSMLVSFATTYQPRFLFIGNENDFFYEQDPTDYARWITFYNAAYTAIKTVSAGTQIGPIFNFEHLAGVGTLNAWTTPNWSALTTHDLTKVDIVGVTVYPWFSYATVATVPDTYLQPLFDHVGAIPVAITESGWPAENLANLNPLWSTSEQEQVDYITKLFGFAQGHNVQMVN